MFLHSDSSTSLNPSHPNHTPHSKMSARKLNVLVYTGAYLTCNPSTRTFTSLTSTRHRHNNSLGPPVHLHPPSPALPKLRRHSPHRVRPAQGAVATHRRPPRHPWRRRPQLLPRPQRAREPHHRGLCTPRRCLPRVLRRRVLRLQAMRVRGRQPREGDGGRRAP